MEPSFSDIKPSAGALDGLGLEGNHATKNGTGNGAANGAAGLDFKLPAEDQIRFRGVQQEIPHFGAPPKRTESLYMKPGEAAQLNDCFVANFKLFCESPKLLSRTIFT